MDDILEILANDARLSSQEIAKLTGRKSADVEKTIKKYEKDGTIVKYKAVIDQDMLKENRPFVRALIEVGITPQKDVGYDSIAERIYSFPEVVSCYLVSGAYDLLVVVEGDSLQTVANFIASKLAPLEAVQRTTTHFLLKKYKEDGQVFKRNHQGKRLNISY